ncbi:MAG: prepilin-type N-terminal cleavage/methylation domain-containing protein [Bacilli bacterium]|nr:prepilin-type N-terminal cleavage/methylation domain-containing protein [Bacilli bacterium]
MKNYKGFTLVEVLVTITVLGIVTLLTLPVISVVTSQLNNKKLESYGEIIESGAKLYTDSKDMDLFGHQKTGCVDVYYTTLVSNKIIEELDFSNQKVIVDKIFVRVRKINNNYSYETFLPTSDDIPSIDFTLCDGSISDSGPEISFSPDGNTRYEKKSFTNVKIKDLIGISPNAKISYQWFYMDGTPIGTAVNKNFKNTIVEELSVKVDTPDGINGKIKLVVTPVDLSNEGGLISTETVQSHEFKLDTIAPVVNIDAYQESGGNRTGGVLASGNNSNVTINGWKTYGYYFDFTRSTDNVGITNEVWSWNQSGKTSLDTTLNGGSGTYTPITNHTLTAPGVRYGSIKLCDEADNCTTKTVQVSVSSRFVIDYNGNGGSGSVGSTVCYYGYDCNLAGNGYSRTGHTFNKWKIDGTNYNAGGSVKNLTIQNKTFTAYAQWNAINYTVYYHVNDGAGYNGNWTTRTLHYGDSIDGSLNPQGSINHYKRFNWWNGNPGTMPDHDITLEAYITDYMCRIVTGHEKYNHVASFIPKFQQAGYWDAYMVDIGWGGYWQVHTAQNMNWWRANQVFDYVWNNTPASYGTYFLVWGYISCDNGDTIPRCRAWAC